jgi:hypothetical protein
MTERREEDFQVVDLDDDLVQQAFKDAGVHEISEEELEDWLLENEPDLPAEETKRIAQGLDAYPFDPDDMFVKHDAAGKPIEYTRRDIVSVASEWYVRQARFFYDIDKPETGLSKGDFMQALAIRIRSTFTGFNLTPDVYKSMLDVLIGSPTVAPGLTIPVWSGQVVCVPGNRERLIFDNGLATINAWREPAYRRLPAPKAELGPFEDLLDFIMPNTAEKTVFLDWLSWCLCHEADKPSWAIFLFSEKHGTGKSTLASIVKKLFGEENTSEQQGVKPLINRFNRPVLTKKLIYAEEVKVSTGSEDGNKLKTLISERSTMSEAKGKDIAPIDHRCCFLLTSNHKPIWLEPGDRRFYIIKVDHEGYSAGGRDYDRFVALIRRVKAAYEDPEQVASLYHALRQRKLDAKFNPYSLNVQEYATEVMKEINTLSGDVVEELLREFVTEKQLFFIPVRYSNQIVGHFANRNPNSSKYVFDRMGWKKGKFAWGGKPAAWAYHDPDVRPERGVLNIAGQRIPIEDHINNALALALQEIGFGITFEYLDTNRASSPNEDW